MGLHTHQIEAKAQFQSPNLECIMGESRESGRIQGVQTGTPGKSQIAIGFIRKSGMEPPPKEAIGPKGSGSTYVHCSNLPEKCLLNVIRKFDDF